jgi:hypothetical protein
MAFQFLSFQDSNGPLELRGGRWLLLPITVQMPLIGPAHKVRRYDVRNSACETLIFLYVEIPRC